MSLKQPQLDLCWAEWNLVPCHAVRTKEGTWANTKMEVQTFITIRSISTKLTTFLCPSVSLILCLKAMDTHNNGGHVRLNAATLETTECGWCHQGGSHGPFFPCVHAATWPTYRMELLQPLRVQIVQGAKLSHGTHDAHFPSAISPPLLSPPTPPPCLGRRTISAPLQAEVEQQHCCGGSMWSALQLCRANCTSSWSRVWVLLKYCSTYITESTLLSCAA